MIRAHDADTIRKAEEPLLAATPTDALMRQAARAVATAVLDELRRRGDRLPGSTVLLLVGGGNNGGDALYAGADLARRGLWVEAVVLSPRPHARALAAARAAGVRVRGGLLPVDDGPEIDTDLLTAAARRGGVWIDGLTGIGATGALRDPLAAAVRLLRGELVASADEPLVVAADVPSGIDVDTGEVHGPVLPATITVTMGEPKPGLLLPPAARLAGRIRTADIGLAPRLAARQPAVVRLTTADLRDLTHRPRREDHKYDRGVLGLHTGSVPYPGAAVLSAAGAIGTGIGMVRFRGPEDVTAAVLARFPEVVPGDGRVQAAALGSGVDPADDARFGDLVGQARELLDRHVPFVLDAGALAAVPELLRDLASRRFDGRVVLTPHAGELARLLTDLGAPATRAEVAERSLHHLRRAQELTGATVLLKGSPTLVLGPRGPVYSQDDGTPWLATAGSGDVLTGIAGALLAAHAGDIEADAGLVAHLAATAAAVHGRAARLLGEAPLRPLVLAQALPAVWAELLAGGRGTAGSGRGAVVHGHETGRLGS